MTFKDFNKKYSFISNDHNKRDESERINLCIHAHYRECMEILRIKEDLKKSHANQQRHLTEMMKRKMKRIDYLVKEKDFGFNNL